MANSINSAFGFAHPKGNALSMRSLGSAGSLSTRLKVVQIPLRVLAQTPSLSWPAGPLNSGPWGPTAAAELHASSIPYSLGPFPTCCPSAQHIKHSIHPGCLLLIPLRHYIPKYWILASEIHKQRIPPEFLTVS